MPFGRLLTPRDIAYRGGILRFGRQRAHHRQACSTWNRIPIGAPAELVTRMPPRISRVPEVLLRRARRRAPMDYVGWIRDAATLGGEGIEHYDGFFRSLAPADVDPIVAAMAETGQITR